jgi:hypothetical protein
MRPAIGTARAGPHAVAMASISAGNHSGGESLSPFGVGKLVSRFAVPMSEHRTSVPLPDVRSSVSARQMAAASR